MRIALLDDHPLVRDALSLRLALEPGFAVRGVYTNSQELLDALRIEPVDVLVLDYQLERDELDGLRLVQLLLGHYPKLRIVIYSSSERPSTVNLVLRAGVKGFVGKSQEVDELLRAIRIVASNRIYLSPIMAQELDELVPSLDLDQGKGSGQTGSLELESELSPKEREVLRCYLEGLSVTQIAENFSRSRKTISGQKQSAYRKLGIRTDMELLKLRAEHGGLDF